MTPKWEGSARRRCSTPGNCAPEGSACR
jgi:hypothetical protein